MVLSLREGRATILRTLLMTNLDGSEIAFNDEVIQCLKNGQDTFILFSIPRQINYVRASVFPWQGFNYRKFYKTSSKYSAVFTAGRACRYKILAVSLRIWLQIIADYYSEARPVDLKT